MIVWVLKPRDDLEDEESPWVKWYDKYFGFVIEAETEEEARQVAKETAWKTDEAWVDEELSTCVPIDEYVKDMDDKIIMSDFHSA